MKLLLVAALLVVTSASSSAAPITLTGTIRDFNADFVNFEGAITGHRPGAVGSTLAGPSPTLTASGATHISDTGPGAFSNWYTKTTDTAVHALTLNETAPGSGIYTYSNNSFFPIDGAILGNQGFSHNYHFTYAIASTFSYVAGANQVFTFSGDDDVWVYFDNLLGIDLGGVHGPLTQTVNLDSLFGSAGGRASGDYAFNFFFAERHTVGSNLAITTSLVLRNNPVPLPEPTSLALTSLALVLVAGSRRMRRS